MDALIHFIHPARFRESDCSRAVNEFGDCLWAALSHAVLLYIALHIVNCRAFEVCHPEVSARIDCTKRRNLNALGDNPQGSGFAEGLFGNPAEVATWVIPNVKSSVSVNATTVG